jgi:hypothetical protein
MLSKTSFRLALVSIAILGIAIAVQMPAARADVVSHVRIVRLSFVEGDVAYQSAGSTWERAVVNLPIREGYSLRTDAGYAEVEFETGLVMRLAGNTQLEFSELNLTDGHRVTSLKLVQGTMIATANLQKGDQVSISAGNAEVTVPHSGRFRIDSAQGQNWVTVFHGKVDVANGGSTTAVENGKTLHFGGAENQSSVDRSPRTDAFDKWASDREQALDMAQSGAGDFVRQRDYMFSTADLYNYGLWSNISGYGMAWQPYGMGANWMPFSNGMWMMGGMNSDWMWASSEPWGWLPYHFGGWVYIDGEGWFWIPQDLGYFQGGNANFVNVGNQMGWTPVIANPVNPRKVRISPITPTRVVFAGGGTRGVIVAGPRGVVPPTTPVKIATHPAGTFVPQGGTTVSALNGAGVIVTSRGPTAPGNMTRTYTAAHGPVSGTVGGPVGTGAPRSGGPGNLGGPGVGRPTTAAPHSSPVAVVRPPSTFTSVGNGGRSVGVTPVNGSGFGSGTVGGTVGGMTGAPTSTASNGSSSGAGGHPTGGTAPAGGGVAPGGTGTKH